MGEEERELDPEEQAMIDRRVRALGQHVAKLVRLPHTSRSHPVFLRAVGQWWRERREEAGLKMSDVAAHLEMTRDEYSLFETGLTYIADLPEGFLEKLAEAIGGPDALVNFHALFGSWERRKRRRPRG